MTRTTLFALLLAATAGCAQNTPAPDPQRPLALTPAQRRQLQQELAEIYAADQGLRQNARRVVEQYGVHSRQADSLWRAIEQIDAQNLPRVTAIIDKYGWPGKSLVGPDGSETAFLVIQHSNLATMQKYAPLMREAAAKGEFEKARLALLEDRILTGQHQPQLYGSQLTTNPVTRKLEFLPITDEAHVDERRATMGMEPLADYALRFGVDYRPPKK